MVGDRLLSSALLVLALGSVATACASEDDDAALEKSDLVTLASGDALWPGPGFALPGAGFLALAVRGERALASVTDPRGAFLAPAPVSVLGDVSSVAGAVISGVPTLYVASATGAAPALRVARLEGSTLGVPQPVVLDARGRTPRVAWWPQVAATPDGRVVLAFVEPQARIFVGVDDRTGSRFSVRELRVPQEDLRGVLSHVAVTRDGTWVVTYQVADVSDRLRSYVLVSRDEGGSWSTPALLAQGSDVRDAFPLARRDGGVDVYYVADGLHERTRFVVVTEKSVLTTLRRRAFAEDGVFGPEETLTSFAVGNVAKPRPTRLPDGRVAVLALTAYRVGATRDLSFAVLDGDAEAPSAASRPE